MNIYMHTPIENLRIRLSNVGDLLIDKRPSVDIEGGLSADDLMVQYSVLVKLNRPESCVDVTVTMIYASGRDTLFSGSLTSRFDVLNLKNHIMFVEGGDEFQIDNDFLPILVNIAFGTTRGYFVHELQGTVLASYPFPMISIENIQKRTSYQLI